MAVEEAALTEGTEPGMEDGAALARLLGLGRGVADERAELQDVGGDRVRSHPLHGCCMGRRTLAPTRALRGGRLLVGRGGLRSLP
jgi:hypothetical protein